MARENMSSDQSRIGSVSTSDLPKLRGRRARGPLGIQEKPPQYDGGGVGIKGRQQKQREARH